MTAHRYEETDEDWRWMEPLLPEHHTGRPLNGIVWPARGGKTCRSGMGRIRRLLPPAGRRYADAHRAWRPIDFTACKACPRASRGPRKR